MSSTILFCFLMPLIISTHILLLPFTFTFASGSGVTLCTVETGTYDTGSDNTRQMTRGGGGRSICHSSGPTSAIDNNNEKYHTRISRRHVSQPAVDLNVGIARFVDSLDNSPLPRKALPRRHHISNEQGAAGGYSRVCSSIRLSHLENEVVHGIHHDTSSLFHNRHSRVKDDLGRAVQIKGCGTRSCVCWSTSSTSINCLYSWPTRWTLSDLVGREI